MHHSSDSILPFLALAAAIALGACSSGYSQSADAPTPVQEQMYAHFRDALDMRAGAIFGDTEQLTDAAKRLAEEPSATRLPPGSERFMQEMRDAALAAIEATRDADRRLAAASVVRACGSCHEAYNVGPDFLIGGAAPGETLLHHMARQSRISRLLWDGLLGPSDETWAQGAVELEGEPPFPREIAARVHDSQLLEESRSRLQVLGKRAETATDPEEKVRVLARVWGVCAGCHGVAGALGPEM